MGYSSENMLGVMDDRDRWRGRESVREICAVSMTR